MGRILLVVRLVVVDLRRHPAHAAMLLISITVATTMLSLGASLHGVTDRLYLQTRAATAGPDLVAVVPGGDRRTTSFLLRVKDFPGVVGHSGPYRHYFTRFTARGATANVVVNVRDGAPGSIDRPLVTSGTWVRPGGVVVERGFASALGVQVGDQVSVAGRSRVVAGIAVSAAYIVYPWATMGGAVGGSGEHAGLVWTHVNDSRPLISAKAPVTSLLYLNLSDPDATEAFRVASRPSRRSDDVTVNLFRWQMMAYQDSVLLRDNQPILVIGSWLLSFLAVAGVATLAAGRAAKQTRRVGLLKAVGAAPGLIATVLLAEYLALALVADALGLMAGRLVAPSIVNPSGSLIATATGPSGSVILYTTMFALGVALLSVLGPTVRALRTETVAALSDTARRPSYPGPLTRVSALLPTPLLLGIRLIARRPGRTLLHACGSTATVAAIVVLLIVYSDPMEGWDLGSITVTDLMDRQTRHLLLGVTVALMTLAVVNTVTITWTTALEARTTMAIARTLGATPGQITAGLSIAQLLPTVPGAIAGLPAGYLLYWPFSKGEVDLPPTAWLIVTVLALAVATAVLTALPARIAAHRPIAQALNAETA